MTLAPTTNHPDCCTRLFVIMLAVSQIKCLTPFMQWNVKGIATKTFVATCSTTGHAANPAASTADSTCQPSVGATRYRAP